MNTETELAKRLAGHTQAPGKIQGWIEVTLHSNEAVAMIDGRSPVDVPSKQIPGLKQFSKQSFLAEEAMGKGCPFAEYLLAQIEEKLNGATEELAQINNKLKAIEHERLKRHDSIGGRAFACYVESSAPFEERYKFGHYASMALRLIVMFDDIVLIARALSYHRVISANEAMEKIKAGGHPIRGLFVLAQGYRYGGCTRSDLESVNPVALRTIENLIKSGFLDRRMFSGPEDICATFKDYRAKLSEIVFEAFDPNKGVIGEGEKSS